jgi:hypothetical protein
VTAAVFLGPDRFRVEMRTGLADLRAFDATRRGDGARWVVVVVGGQAEPASQP